MAFTAAYVQEVRSHGHISHGMVVSIPLIHTEHMLKLFSVCIVSIVRLSFIHEMSDDDPTCE